MVFWVFGYGSLVWNPGFDYDEKMIGFIKDYRRVFDLGKALPHALLILFCARLVQFKQLPQLLRHGIMYLQPALTTGEHQKAQQELAHWRRKKEPFA